MKEVRHIVFCLVILLGVWGCKKEETIPDPEPEPISEIPAITFISMEPGTAVKYQDAVKIRIEYIDGDADLGENRADVKNLFCTDSRNNVTYEFRIPQLAPDSADIAIKGQLTFDLPPQGFIDDSHTTESTVYSIYVKDRAGNQSNTVQTTTLTINE